MTIEEKRHFLETLFRDVQSEMIDKLPETPDNWNGMELRVWSAEKMNALVWRQYDLRKGRDSRARDYRNTVLVKNLI
jgi:hypothetical protein